MNDVSLEKLLKVNPAARTEQWENDFLKQIPLSSVRLLAETAQQGPDSWPYLFVATDTNPLEEEPVKNILYWLSDKGVGLAFNPHKHAPDFVLTYGMIWNFRERGEFLSAQTTQDTSTEFVVQPGEQLYVGPPSETYLPDYARKILRQFWLDQGIMQPKIAMVSKDQINFDLCFSAESLNNPPQPEWKGIAEAISWFLPLHYSITVLSESTFEGFTPL